MTSTPRPFTAVIADDEPWLRADLREQLAACWPELEVVGEAADGVEAVQLVQRLACDVVFLDVQMPRMTGVDAAARLKGQVEIVFLTAYDQHALAAFEHRAADYLLKPLAADRLADTVARLRARLADRRDGQAVAQRLAALERALVGQASGQAAAHEAAAHEPAAERLEWIKAVVGNATRLIAIDEVLALRAVPGYTQVVTAETEALIRTPLRDLLPGLDPRRFVQVHRNAIVNLRAVAVARRLADGRYAIELRHGRGTIETSRSRAGVFREE